MLTETKQSSAATVMNVGTSSHTSSRTSTREGARTGGHRHKAAKDEPRERQAKSLPEYHPPHTAYVGSEGDVNADLSRAFGDQIRQDAVQPDHRKPAGEGREGDEKHEREPARRHLFGQGLLQRPELRWRLSEDQGFHYLAKPRFECLRLGCGANNHAEKGPHRLLRSREENQGRALTVGGLLHDVLHDPDNRPVCNRRGFGRQFPPNRNSHFLADGGCSVQIHEWARSDCGLS